MCLLRFPGFVQEYCTVCNEGLSHVWVIMLDLLLDLLLLLGSGRGRKPAQGVSSGKCEQLLLLNCV